MTTAAQAKIKIETTPAALPDMPLAPEQITAANPVARGAILMQSTDRKVSSGYWSCEVGEFDWEYTWDEFVHVLEGEVEITEEGGPTHRLTAGQTAFFPLGLKTHWHVIKPIRKFFVVRTPQPI